MKLLGFEHRRGRQRSGNLSFRWSDVCALSQFLQHLWCIDPCCHIWTNKEVFSPPPPPPPPPAPPQFSPVFFPWCQPAKMLYLISYNTFGVFYTLDLCYVLVLLRTVKDLGCFMQITWLGGNGTNSHRWNHFLPCGLESGRNPLLIHEGAKQFSRKINH